MSLNAVLTQAFVQGTNGILLYSMPQIADT